MPIKFKLNEISLHNINDVMLKTFMKLGHEEVKMYAYILLNDMINKKFLIGKSNFSEEQINQLKNINSQINKNNDLILFENIDRALNDEVLDILDIEVIKNSISIIPGTQVVATNQPISSTSQISGLQSTNTENHDLNLNNPNENSTNNNNTNNNLIVNANNSLVNTNHTQTNSNICLEHLKKVFTESIISQNLCSKSDLNHYIQEKFNEFGSLFITTSTAEEHINTIEELLTK